MEETTEIVEIDVSNGNYIIIKQELDSGFVGSMFLFMVMLIFTMVIMRVIWNSRW